MAKKYTRGGETGKGITFKSGESLPKKNRAKKKIPAHRGTGISSSPAREIKVGKGTLEYLIGFILGDNNKDIYIDVPEHRSKKVTKVSEKNKLRVEAANSMRELSNSISIMAGEQAGIRSEGLLPSAFEKVSGRVGQNPNINELESARRAAYRNIQPPENVVNMEENIPSDVAGPTNIAERAPIVESPELGTPPPDMRGGSPFEGRPVADVARPVDRAAPPPQMGGTGPMSNQRIIGLGETAAARSPEEYTRENMEKRRREAEAAQNIINQRTQPAVTDETPAGQAVTDTDDYPAVMYRYGGAVTPKRKKRKKRLYKGGKVNSYNY